MLKNKRKVDERVLQKRRSESCWCCGYRDVDAAHVKSRGSGGPDEEWNVIALCRRHHTEQHQIGFVKMLSKYTALNMKMKLLGWSVRDGFLNHPKLEIS